jgi:hypothetical protein
MSYEAVRWAMYDAPMLLTAAGKPDTAARAVLIARAERADKAGRSTYAGTADLSRVTGYDERTIERAERRLEGAGLLIRAGRSHLGTVMWHLDMSQKQAEGNQGLAEARVERRRKADAIRQQRARERRKALSSGSAEPVDNGPSIEPDVSTKICVTDAESVTSRTQNPDVTDLNGVTSRTQRPPNHPVKPPVEPPGLTTPGGAPPPGPRRRPPPPASANEPQQSLTDPLTPAQDQQGESLPHARDGDPAGPLAIVIPLNTRRIS